MNLAIAFGAGILSFVSPCVLPLVPAYLVNLAGESALSGADRRRTIAHAAVFVAGFSAVFTLLWIGIALLGSLGADFVTWLQRVAGVVLVVLGMHMVGLITIPFLERATDLRIEGTTSGYRRSLLIGVAFGAGWTPCIGPYLALILTILLNSDLASGAVLLLAYSLGLGVPFLLVAGGLGSVQRGLDWVRLHIRAVNAVGGTLVIVMGLLLLSGQLARLNQLFNFLPLLG
ncbi:MAG TPA: cytochrome C biogenesis protein [Chloroflexi bacterium]|jgi:cytochrome c-type biogenesis protein|nr:cytochrome C biogenesis protein [Chloroflexota bacterium]HAL26795.1 cytochrome C biogenesis protein [Chloroflexota bacterium]